MSFKITDFMSKFTKDGARPNLFEIKLPIPNNLETITNNENFSFKCRASAIPGSEMSMVGAYYFGRLVKFAGTRSFRDWTVAIMMDETDYDVLGVRHYLENWMNAINGHVENKRNSNFVAPSTNSGYWANGKVTHFGKDGTIIGRYEMQGCFPVAISDVPLDWGNNNAIAEFQVTFAMQFWTRGEESNLSTDPAPAGL